MPSAKVAATVRKGTPADAEQLAVLGTQVWLHTYATRGVSPVIARYVLAELGVGKFLEMLSDDGKTVLVAERDGHLVGYAVVNPGAKRPAATSTDLPMPAVELATLYVQAHFAGQGVGTSLLAQSHRVAQLLCGQSSLWLTVNAKNLPAIAFYRKHGFVETGTTCFELGEEQHENLVLVGKAP